ncbi:flagellar basal-body protein FlbY [Brevundimonas sp.]|uniref:flagellar basal-body protein FlbY n=1 Tax=Brevundimonas sp. TaxID=1871086 RepID=UPI001D4F233F|nr:flagellar basal-body protein FlbY [Brevundimonas sp.]MBA4001080.1 flagellar basal-body protein FlbY [Brevundimonas sp.]
MTPTENATHLTALTERLTERLSEETRCFEARRPQDVAAGIAETQEMANLYRRETARVKADRRLLEDLPTAERDALIAATQAFEAVLARHNRALEAAKTITEGLVQAIAQEVAAARAQGAGYGAGGRAAGVDGRAVTLNRKA